MPKSDYNPNTKKWEKRDSAEVTKTDDPDTMSQDEVEASGGLAAAARRKKKNSAGAQGDALKVGARPTPRATPTATPRPKSGY